jgi:peptidoglycan hydrolase-like protein with peptidoglycan-binding domain
MGSEHRQYLWSDLQRIESFSTGKALRLITPAPPLSSRKDTLNIQQALQKAGYFKGRPTGFYGKRTKASVRNFQKANGLPATGTVGPQTWAKLKVYL